MGIYDIYDDVQIKIGDVKMDRFEIGDEVPLEDGIYIGNEGAIVVIEKILIAKFTELYTKWGDVITTDQILRPHSRVTEVVEVFEKE